MASARATREESWDSLHCSEASNDQDDEDYEDSEQSDEEYRDEEVEDEMMEGEGSPQFRTVNSVHRALHPLQSTADRVGKQVEQFAESLDRLSSHTQSQVKDYRHVLPLVREYEKIAADTVKRLKRFHEAERQEQLRDAWRQKLRSVEGEHEIPDEKAGQDTETLNTSTVKDLRHWEQEFQTWQLLRLMLQCHYPIPPDDSGVLEQEERFIRPRTAKVHRYSLEQDVWKKFLEENDDAWEANVVVEWLMTSADQSGQDIDTMMEDLEDGAHGGSGLFAPGWLYSKEAIKAQKRLRSWPQPLDPVSPGIDISLVSADKSSGLVTQLDPDAFSRQGRSLEKEDIRFERATWLACWEMMRRGRSWNSIRDWCKERFENWRALSICGDPRMALSCGQRTSNDAMAGWQTRSIWRNACADAANHGGIDKYENAVYGLLCGDLTSVEKVLRGWDDHLFATYSAQLILHFDFYLQAEFPDRIPQGSDGTPAVGKTHVLKPEWFSGPHMWKTLLDSKITEQESKSPMKMLQGSLIANGFPEYAADQGLALGRELFQGLAAGNERSEVEGFLPFALHQMSKDAAPAGPTAGISVHDHDMLRILTHIILIFNELEPPKGRSIATENIILGYVNYLGRAGKQQLLPLYASQLSDRGSIECMARQLPTILDARERRTIMNLMTQYEMNVVKILNLQIQLLAFESREETSLEGTLTQLKILDPNGPDQFGLPAIIGSFVGQEVGTNTLDLIRGLEWYLLLDGHWNATMWAASLVYRVLLRGCNIAGARELSKRIPFSTISIAKTPGILGRTIDLSIEQSDDEDEDEPNTPQRQARTERDHLLENATTFRDLEAVVLALYALEAWQAVAAQHVKQDNKRHAVQWKAELQEVHEVVVASVEPLLSGWLEHPEDESDVSDLQSIRNMYLPEIVLAYLTVLNFGGHALSRDMLLQGMELATRVAGSGTAGSELALCFVEARRMAELVDALARVSKSILHADEKPYGGSVKKGRRAVLGAGLDMWNVEVVEERVE